MAWAPDPYPGRAAASTAASTALHRGAGKTPSAKGHCARSDPAIAASRQRRVAESYDPWGSVYAPSSRFSGASCTVLLLLGRLRCDPVLRRTLTHKQLVRVHAVAS